MTRAGDAGMTTNTPSPCFVLELPKLISNLEKISQMAEDTGVTILHTIKSFHHIDGLVHIDEYLGGFSIGNLREYEHISTLKPSHIHTYAPYIFSEEIDRLASLSTTMSFNSLSQWQKYSHRVSSKCSLGLRINPRLNLRLPKQCNPNKSDALGVDSERFLSSYSDDPSKYRDLRGLHFHSLCFDGVSGLKYLLSDISSNYGEILGSLEWINLGGGHDFGSSSYSVDGFVEAISIFQESYPDIELIFEPGEGVLRDSGYFSSTIVDIIPSTTPIAILDTSTETHMLDIAITGVNPRVRGASHDGIHHYILAGMSCIAGDTIGEYRFDTPLSIGDRVVFEDMIAYSMVKQTEYNGIESASFLSVGRL